MSLQTIEEKIIAEWNIVRAFIATHQTISLIGVGLMLWLLGRIHIPV